VSSSKRQCTPSTLHAYPSVRPPIDLPLGASWTERSTLRLALPRRKVSIEFQDRGPSRLAGVPIRQIARGHTEVCAPKQKGKFSGGILLSAARIASSAARIWRFAHKRSAGCSCPVNQRINRHRKRLRHGAFFAINCDVGDGSAPIIP